VTHVLRAYKLNRMRNDIQEKYCGNVDLSVLEEEILILNKEKNKEKYLSTRKERFCWGIKNFAEYRSENNFVGSSK